VCGERERESEREKEMERKEFLLYEERGRGE